MEDMKAKAEERKAILKGEFEMLDKQKAQLVEQGKQIQKKLNDIQVRQVQLQGAFAEIENLCKEDKKEEKPKK